MPTSKKDKQILQDLAKQVAEIAALPVQQETIALWKALNGLRPVRPMVMIDQIPWHEMETDGELALQTQDPFLQRIETDLRRTLYHWRHMPVDMVVEPVVHIPKVIHNTGFGLKVVEETAITDPASDVLSHHYEDQLKTEEDLAKIRIPQVTLDVEATARAEERAHEIFDGILEVHMQGMFLYFNVWDWIVTWRGAENVIWDLVERPEFSHKIMARITEGQLALLDQLEAQGLLGWRQSTIHCTGAYTDELPAPGFDPQRVRAKDLWTFGMAQIFATVSPAMHKEFENTYAAKFFERFGLVYYGCCEPLHNKIDIIRELPHVRKISMSPWVDQVKGAEAIGRDYVFSRKPNPAFLAAESWSPETVREDLQHTVDICARYGCPVELILKDISTVRYQPQRLWEWGKIAMEVVQG
jgi:hypothetical protein